MKINYKKITSKEHNGIITREYCMVDDIMWMNKKRKMARSEINWYCKKYHRKR